MQFLIFELIEFRHDDENEIFSSWEYFFVYDHKPKFVNNIAINYFETHRKFNRLVLAIKKCKSYVPTIMSLKNKNIPKFLPFS